MAITSSSQIDPHVNNQGVLVRMFNTLINDQKILYRLISSARVRLCVVSTLVGIWFVGPNQILPGNTRWLRPTPGRIDHAVAQLNWEFLRWTKVVQWPMTALPNLGEGWNTVYVPFSSGSLFGMFLKYLDPLLPGGFQFLGIWLIVSFSIFGFSAGMLMSRLSHDRDLQFLGGCLFLLSPVVYYRVGVLGHFELSAHWLLLLSFFLALGPNTKQRYWSMLLIVSIAINIYLAAMVAVIFVGSTISAMVYNHDLVRGLRHLLVGSITCFVSLWIFGFFAYSGNARGLGFFRVNGASFLYSKFSLAGVIEGNFSRFFRSLGVFDDRPFIGFEREGFSYLGLGIIVGTVIAFCLLIKFYSTTFEGLRIGYVAICASALVLFLNALSPKIAVGRRELLDVPVPSLVFDIRQIFRTAERFAWPFYYLIVMTVALVIMRSSMSKRIRVSSLLVILLIQFWDISGGINASRNALRSESEVPVLQEQEWDKLFNGRESVTMYPVFDFIDDEQSLEIESWRTNTRFFSILEYAAKNRLTINFSVTGRPVTEIVSRENLRVEGALQRGNLDTSTVYVLPTIDRWNYFRMTLDDRARFISIDGFFLILPDIN